MARHISVVPQRGGAEEVTADPVTQKLIEKHHSLRMCNAWVKLAEEMGMENLDRILSGALQKELEAPEIQNHETVVWHVERPKPLQQRPEPAQAAQMGEAI